MTVTRVALAWAGSTGSSSKNGREYTATYNVETDTHLDQTKTIIDYFRDTVRFEDLTLPYLDMQYEFANDVDPVALCDSITPKRQENSQKHWQVEFHYKTPEEEDEETGEKENGEASNNPLDWRPTCDISFVERARPVVKAIYRGGFTNGLIQEGEEYAVVNSAMAVLDPPLERSAFQTLFRFGRYWFEYPWAARFAVTAVNKRPFRLLILDPNTVDKNGRPTPDNGALNVSFDSYQCQISSLNAALIRKNGFTLWKLSTEMLYDREFGFRVDVLDRGFSAKAGDGDPDGRGGFFTPNDTANGVAPLRALLDPNGLAAPEPVLLDGNGQPLALGADPVYSTWSIYPELSFQAFSNILPIKE